MTLTPTLTDQTQIDSKLKNILNSDLLLLWLFEGVLCTAVHLYCIVLLVLIKCFIFPQIVNGYLVHFFAPSDLPKIPKNVVFVIDRSGSMSGRKMQQVNAFVSVIMHHSVYIFVSDFENFCRPAMRWKPF